MRRVYQEQQLRVTCGEKNSVVAYRFWCAMSSPCRELGLLERPDALEKLALLAKYGRYKDSILEDARRKLEVKP